MKKLYLLCNRKQWNIDKLYSLVQTSLVGLAFTWVFSLSYFEWFSLQEWFQPEKAFKQVQHVIVITDTNCFGISVLPIYWAQFEVLDAWWNNWVVKDIFRSCFYCSVLCLLICLFVYQFISFFLIHAEPSH